MPRNTFFLLLLLTFPAVLSALENQLKDNASPYLALHADDRVEWQRWDQSVLDRARRENKLIFISSGYFACHWCHVMRRESYNNRDIARLLNRFFIPVKIDRELEPALDSHLIEFVRRTRGRAGWPLNVFLTPEGYPLIGLTYAPVSSFRGLLERLQSLWDSKQQELAETARTASEALTETPATQEKPQQIDPSRLAEALILMTHALADDMEGGIGQQNRFPMSPLWDVLLTLQKSHPDQRLKAVITLTLDQMAEKGLRDHLSGGFFRYTVDPAWHVPHFEKMLYTQALQAALFLKAGKVLDRPAYLEVARDTINFTLDVLAGEQGGFIASLSAVDPQDVEGGGYLWRKTQLQALLTEKERIFAEKRWGLMGDSANEGGYLPLAAASLDQLVIGLQTPLDELRELEASVRKKLMQDSVRRAHPRDNKQLAAWNGLMLTTLVQAADVFKDDRYRQAAGRLRDYLVNQLWNGQRLYRARDAAGEIGQATLEDYAFVAKGLYQWGTKNRDQDTIDLAKRLVKASWQRFYRDSGWRTTDRSLIPGIKSETVLPDNPMPSPIPVLARLTLELGADELKKKALEALNRGYPQLQERPLWYATHVMGLIETAVK